MNQFTAEHTPAEIVKLFPKASDLFKQRKIDFCCGGNRLLTDVFTEKSLDEMTVLTELNKAYTDWLNKGHATTDWDALSMTELIDYITKTYHDTLEQELSSLNGFVTRVLSVLCIDNPSYDELYNL